MNKISFYVTILVLFISYSTAKGIPAKRIPFNLTLSDGTTILATLVGDETFHYYASFTDGTPIVMNDDGTYRLAPEEKETIASKWATKMAERNAGRFTKRFNTLQSGSKVRKTFGYPTSFKGKKRGIVILVNFKNRSINPAHTQAVFDKQFNEEGYTGNTCKGSVHDFFYDSSYGQFDLTFDIFGPVTVSQNIEYYGANNSEGNDKYPGTLVTEACKAANRKYTINWGDYDWDGDGYVDQVFIIYAGYGEHFGAPTYTIWPHEYELSNCKLAGDGNGPVYFTGTDGTHIVDTYAVSCELTGTSGNDLDFIGTPCHEFAHCLGIPDFYDTSYSGGYGMAGWDPLSEGSDSGTDHGNAPTGFTAYERWFAGWLELQELTEPTTITDMPCLADSAVAYVIYNDNNRNEYFILENRQNKGWHEYVGSTTDAHGLLIYHVDYDEEAWVNDCPNSTASHQRMCIIPAGKKYGDYYAQYGQYITTPEQYKSQVFPGSGNVRSLTNTSHLLHGGRLFTKNTDGTYLMNKPITEIKEKNGLISFEFMGGTPTDIQSVEAVESNTEYYTLDGIRVNTPSKPGIYIIRNEGKTKKMYIR